MRSRLPSTRAGVLRGLLLALLLFFVAVAVAWALLLPTIVTAVLRSKTGFGVRIEQLTINPFTAKVELRGLLLRNPDGYQLEDFVEVREFRAEPELFSLLGDRFVADEVMVDVPKLTLVKNEQGRLNALAFKEGLLGKEEPAGQNTAAKAFLIRHLVLKFDQLVYADYSGKKAGVKEYNLKLNRDLRDVTSPLQILNPLAGAFAGAGMANDVVGGIFKTSGDALKATGDTLRDAGKKTGETLKGVFDSLEKKLPKK